MQKTVLITGGSGLIGSYLTQLLLTKGYLVKHISRQSSKGAIPSFTWNLDDKSWQPQAIEEVDYIVHLAGANVGEGRWNSKRKLEILNSRVISSQLVCQMVEASNGKIKRVISSSSIGYYGVNNEKNGIVESATPGDDFLAQVCVQWEQAISKSEAKVVILRTGIVLSNMGGALPKMLTPIKLGVGAPLGTGEQLMPWIHIDDLCEMFVFALQNTCEGVFNACAPHVVSNKVFTKCLAEAAGKRLLLPNVPGFVLKLILGEMAEILLSSLNPSIEKIKDKGFEWKYLSVKQVFNQLLK